jgi:hypothetical protein
MIVQNNKAPDAAPAAATPTTQPAPEATPSTTPGSDTQAATAPQEPALSGAALAAKAESGEPLTDAELEAYEAFLLDGGEAEPPPAAEPQTQEAPPAPQVDAFIEELMREVGAKSKDEIASKVRELRGAVSAKGQEAAEAKKSAAQLTEYLAKAKAGDPDARRVFMAMIGIDPQGAGQGGAPSPAKPTADPVLSQFLYPEDQMDGALDPDFVAFYNKGITNLYNIFDRRLKEALAPIEKTNKYIDAQASKAADAHYQKKAENDVQKLLTDYKDDYGIPDDQVQPLLKLFLAKRESEIPEQYRGFIDTINSYISGEAPSIEAAHKIRFYEQGKRRIAEARMDAERGQNGGQKQPAASGTATERPVQGEELEAIIKGEAPIPEQWMDEDGLLPDPKKAPRELLSALGLLT